MLEYQCVANALPVYFLATAYSVMILVADQCVRALAWLAVWELEQSEKNAKC